MNTKIKIRNFILLFFLFLLVLIHIIYFTEIRTTISNNEEQYIKELQCYVGSYTTPRHVADRFVWCFCLSGYFLIGYLWSAGQHYYLYDTEEWIAKYSDIFKRSVVLAPIIIQISVYAIYTLLQYIQYKRNGCLERKWKIRHFIYISVLILIMIWIFIIGLYV